MPTIREVHYRAASPARGALPGRHRSTRGAAGFEFRGHLPLLDAPDPRRLDLHASLRDPFGGWLVRQSSERRAIALTVVGDLSASMAFAADAADDGGGERRIDVLADLVESLAWSAWRNGDGFGFIGCDEQLRREWLQPQTRQRGAGLLLAARLRQCEPRGRDAQGLLEVHRHLPLQRGLVFIVSDFHLPLPLLRRVLDSLAGHDLVPVVLWHPSEFTLGARSGLATLLNPESGRRRLVWWRPALAARWQAAHEQRRAALQQLFAAQRLRALWLEGSFDADALTRYFHG